MVAMLSFEEVLRQEAKLFVILATPGVSANGEIWEVKLLGIEPGGIWVECQALTEVVLKSIQQSVLGCTPIIFLPFSSIQFAGAFLDRVALSETLGSWTQ